MTFRNVVRLIAIVPVVGFMLVGYTNCGGFQPGGEGSTASTSPGGGGADSSLRSVCEQDLRKAFDTSYRPFLSSSSTCLNCHNEAGGSPIKFAARDAVVAFNAFMLVGADRADANAVNASHGPGKTGPALASQVQNARSGWDPAFQAYQSCMSSGSAGGGATNVLEMIEKNAAELYFGDGRTIILGWTLAIDEASPASARFPGFFTMEVKVQYEGTGANKVAVGYTFSNPKLQMLTGEVEAEIEGIVVTVNGVQVSGTEPFRSARKTARGIDPVTLYEGAVTAKLREVSSGDKIGVGFGFLNVRARTDNPPTPPTPTLAAAASFIRLTTVNLQITNDGTARRWCVSTSPTRPASTSVPCPGFEGATTSGWLTARPANVDLAVLLNRAPANGEAVQVYLWIANSDLKVSATAAQTSVTYDTTPPAAPTLSGIAPGPTQIADLLGVQDIPEQVTWCVKVASTRAGAENADNCRFGPNKPQFVGLTARGVSWVAIHARDRAGNAARSAAVSVTSPHEAITFTALSGAGTAQGVFASRCFSCHGPGGTQVAKWDASSYANTVARKTQILNSIQNSSMPMPPSGLLDPRERALIELWFNQGQTPFQ